MVLSHLCLTVDKVNIISVDYDWVRYGQGRNDKFRNVRIAGGFVINATELRLVNFSMQAVDVLSQLQHASSGCAAAIYTVTETRQACCGADCSSAKAYKMHKDIDSEIRGRCW